MSLLATPLALPLYLAERIGRSDRRAPMTDVVMHIAQDLGIATVRTFGHMRTMPGQKKVDLRSDTNL